MILTTLIRPVLITSFYSSFMIAIAAILSSCATLEPDDYEREFGYEPPGQLKIGSYDEMECEIEARKAAQLIRDEYRDEIGLSRIYGGGITLSIYGTYATQKEEMEYKTVMEDCLRERGYEIPD